MWLSSHVAVCQGREIHAENLVVHILQLFLLQGPNIQTSNSCLTSAGCHLRSRVSQNFFRLRAQYVFSVCKDICIFSNGRVVQHSGSSSSPFLSLLRTCFLGTWIFLGWMFFLVGCFMKVSNCLLSIPIPFHIDSALLTSSKCVFVSICFLVAAAENPVSAAGAEPWSVLWRFPTKCQSDWEQCHGPALPGKMPCLGKELSQISQIGSSVIRNMARSVNSRVNSSVSSKESGRGLSLSFLESPELELVAFYM